MTEAIKLVKWVYEGFSELSGGRKGHAFHSLDQRETKHNFAASGKGWTQAFLPGGIYEARETDSGINGLPKLLEMHPNREERVLWEARHRAMVGRFEERARAKRMRDDSEIRNMLAPLKKAMRGTNGVGRTAIKVFVLSELDKY